MQIDAVWLLKNHRYLLSRQKFLQALIPVLESQSITNEEIIEGITYLRGCVGTQPKSTTKDMNKAVISGMITEKSELRMEPGDIPHLILHLSVRHKIRSGEFCSEIYRVSAWRNMARWGVDNLRRGQIIGVQGYLTQRPVRMDNVTAVSTEIAVDEFLPMRQALREESGEAAEAPLN